MSRLTVAKALHLALVVSVELAVAAAVRVLALPSIRRKSPAARRMIAPLAGCATETHLIWAMDVTAARFPRLATCLVRALTAELLLASHVPLRVTIGVRRVAGAFEAHAWVEREGQTPPGGSAADHTPGEPNYEPILSWQR